MGLTQCCAAGETAWCASGATSLHGHAKFKTSSAEGQLSLCIIEPDCATNGGESSPQLNFEAAPGLGWGPRAQEATDNHETCTSEPEQGNEFLRPKKTHMLRASAANG